MIREHRNPKNKLKLSPLGQAYSTKLKNSHETKVSLKDEKVKFEDLMIITPPLVNDDLFIETGLQKHLLVVYDSSIDKYIATHYLTRKPTAEKLCDKEFKVFQNEQQYPEKTFVSKKSQNIFGLKTPRLINKEMM